jgi:hypothetical protein
MALEEIRERIISHSKALWEKIEESSFYNQLKDRFENLSPLMQKVVITVGSFSFVALLFSFPLGFYSNSREIMSVFDEQRTLTREMLKAAREASQVPPLAGTPDSSDLQARIQEQLKKIRLLPEQVRSVQVISLPATIIAQNIIAYGTEVSLSKINLNQAVSIGHLLSILESTTTKVKDMEMVPHSQDPRYLDTVFRLVTFKVPQYQPLFPAEKEKKSPRNNKRKSRMESPSSSEDSE